MEKSNALSNSGSTTTGPSSSRRRSQLAKCWRATRPSPRRTRRLPRPAQPNSALAYAPRQPAASSPSTTARASPSVRHTAGATPESCSASSASAGPCSSSQAARHSAAQALPCRSCHPGQRRPGGAPPTSAAIRSDHVQGFQASGPKPRPCASSRPTTDGSPEPPPRPNSASWASQWDASRVTVPPEPRAPAPGSGAVGSTTT
mmetsp:Transcript_80135/g.238657  ORF Transcript_80135/g.238657 Transcript_80135/m.238657 type:complete len:203 (-) Transcript_80135:18-626(-)